MAGLIKEEHKSDFQKEIDKRIKEKIFNMLWSRVKAQAKPDDGIIMKDVGQEEKEELKEEQRK